MSYRDIRNFTEMLRALGYPTLISMESFRQPNFPLVADLLIWFAKRFDPDVDLPSVHETEDERVNLIRNAAQFMAIKANIKFNTKRLYQADGFAVKELLKVATLLYEALKVNEIDRWDDYDDVNLKEFDISDKLHDLKQSRQLASEITSTGATLFDLLSKEVELKSARNLSSSKQYEVSEVESGIKKAIEAIKEEITETKQLIDNVSATEASLDAKIERRKIEIDRYEKRLQTLKKVKPAFLEEFNSLESELEKLFIQYSLRLRCLNQLEKAATEAEKAHIEKQRVITKIPQNVMVLDEQEEEGGEGDDDQRAEIDKIITDDDRIDNESQMIQKQERPRARTGRLRSERPTTNIFAGKQHDNGSLSGSSLDLSDSETDIFLDKDESELQHSDDDDSFGFDVPINRKKNLEDEKSGRKTVNKIQDNSDDDF